MLGKLIKHEFKATSRLIPFIYLAVFVFGMTTFIGFMMKEETVGVISYLLTLLAGVTAYIATLVGIAIRFYKSMFSQEGYLTQTLPVTSGKLLLSKAITAFIWLVASYIVMLGSIFLCVVMIDFDPNTLEAIKSFFSPYASPIFWISLVEIIGGSLYFVAEVFFATALGNTGIFNKQGAGISVLLYLGINFVVGIITNICTTFIPLSIVIDPVQNTVYFSTQTMVNDMLESMFGETSSITVSIGSQLLQLILIPVFFILTDKLLKRKLCMK